MHLILAKYSDDAERKRIENAIERWKQVISLRKAEGLPIIVEEQSEKVKDFLDDLYSRTSDDKVVVFNLSEATFEIEMTEKSINIEVNEDIETIEKLIGIIIAKQNATFKYEIQNRKSYNVYTKKGKAEILTQIKEVDDRVLVSILIKGYGEAPGLIYDKINSELKYIVEIPKKNTPKESIDISDDIEQIISNTDVRPDVLKAVFNVAFEISRDGREGNPVGTAFIIGDVKKVLANSKQLILNPFEGHKPEERMVTNPDLVENIKELAQLDGAFVISGDGVIESSARYITVDASRVDISKGMGTRHSSMAGITQITNAVGIVVSQSGGKISMFKNGKIIKSYL